MSRKRPTPTQEEATARLRADRLKCPKCGKKAVVREFQDWDGDQLDLDANCRYVSCLFSWVERFSFVSGWPKEQ